MPAVSRTRPDHPDAKPAAAPAVTGSGARPRPASADRVAHPDGARHGGAEFVVTMSPARP
jgi:hypothetical protein